MQAEEIIHQITSSGGQIWVEGDKVRARLPERLRPLVSVIHSLKPELIAELGRRPQMPAGVRLVSWQPKAAPVRLSECSTVTNVEKFISVTLVQLEASLCGRQWHAGWPLSVLLERLVGVGVVVVLDDPKKALR